ncbi:MAG: D-alanine--D-alanine ligase [Lentisphaeraceae bacterium]|nr:D-alanine--D-alanine ligase [Lentisphaeraceae bacterium]
MILAGNLLAVGSGVRLSRLVNKLVKLGMGGGEALIAVPGAVGGALRMNAGAQGVEIGDLVVAVKGLRSDGTLWEKKGEEISWSYRSSDIPADVILTEAVLRFEEVDCENALEKISKIREFRKRTQPGGKNPGCAFRNPVGDSAGRLIDKYGLKELAVGHCSVSSIHANFFVNNGSAREEDFVALLNKVQKNIYNACGIILENEVMFSNKQTIDSARLLTIAVLKGGPSSEREISIQSGEAVAQALRDGGHQVIEIDIVDYDLPALPENVDLVFPVLHGVFGEDGQVQSLLDETKIPYVGTTADASRITIDKYATCNLLRENGVDTPKSQLLLSLEDQVNHIDSYPVIVKPNSQGSTIGMSIVSEEGELADAIAKAFSVDDKVIVEEFVKGQETTVGLLYGEALPVVEIIPPDGFFDFDAKYTYTKGQTIYNCPPLAIPEVIQKRMQEIAVRCFDICQARHLLRVDIIWRPEDDRLTVLEVNTMPGFTANSLLPKSAREAGMSFTELCCKLAMKSL